MQIKKMLKGTIAISLIGLCFIGIQVFASAGYKIPYYFQKLRVPQVDDATAPTLSFGDGDTGFFESADDDIAIAIAGSMKYSINSTGIYSKIGNVAPILLNEVSTPTNPGFSFINDYDTGMGSAGADILSLIAGGVEGHRITEAAGVITHILTGKASVASSTAPTVDLVVGPTTANGTTTIAMGKIQFDGYNSAGTRSCVYLVGTTLTAVAGACNP